jgi:O-antigen/teichoic acid export membrane protein
VDTTPKAPSLATQVSRAVLWNTIFVPLRMLAEIVATLVKLNLLTPASFGLLALISGANNGLGTVVDLGTTRVLPKYIPETSRSGGPRAVLCLITVVFAAQVIVLVALTIGLVLGSRRYLASLGDKVLADPTLDADTQGVLLGFLGDFGWLIIGAIVALLLLGVCYDLLMAYLNSFFKQKVWNGIALAAGLLPPLLSAAAIILLPEQWAILGVLLATVLAPMIAVALAGWQVFRLQIADLRLQNREFRIQNSEFRTENLEPRTWNPEPRTQNSEPRTWNLAAEGRERTTERGAKGFSVLGSGFSKWFSVLGSWFSKWFFLPKGFLRYTGVSFLMTLTDFIASAQFAIFFAGNIRDVALLTAGANLARMALGYLYTPMVGVQVPLFTRVRQGEGGTLNGAYQSLVRLQVLLLIPGAVGLILLTQSALLVISPDYLAAAPLVWVLVICLFVECLLTTAHNALIVYEHLGIIVASRLLTLLVIVPLALWLPPLYGIVGVALAFGLARVVAGLWATASGYRLLGLRWPWRFTLRVMLASAAMALLVLVLRGTLPPIPASADLAYRLREALLLCGIAAVAAGGFFVALRLLGGLDPRDKEQLARMKLPLKKWILRVI